MDFSMKIYSLKNIPLLAIYRYLIMQKLTVEGSHKTLSNFDTYSTFSKESSKHEFFNFRIRKCVALETFVA